MLGGRVRVNHQVDPVYMYAAGRDIGRDQDTDDARGEHRQTALTRPLG